jgi:hypothetical protein
MSAAKPMTTTRRMSHYLRGRDPYMRSDRDLTPAQRRRGWHKAHRAGKGGPGTGEELRGSKGRPTPKQKRSITA